MEEAEYWGTRNLNLLSSASRVEVPFVQVTIGDYVFGVFQQTEPEELSSDGKKYKYVGVKYPNFITSLNIVKVNGKVNQYTLVLNYPIHAGDDPNFFEKIFGSVSDTRVIKFSYGDMSVPSYIFRDEEAIITTIQTQFSAMNSVITYTISAVSSSFLATSANLPPINPGKAKPTDIIYQLLYETPAAGLLEVFPGMSDKNMFSTCLLIKGQEKAVTLKDIGDSSAFEYLSYLVSCIDDGTGSAYVLQVVDDVTGDYGGSYFKIVPVESGDDFQTYQIDIGYPSQNVVTSFSVSNNETYSLFYKYQNSINDAEYVQRINDNGELENVFAPVATSGNPYRETFVDDETWWKKATKYPISAEITLKGLLRPAILMTNIRLNVYYYGRKHISSGLYIITSQKDQIDSSGYRTTLTLTRIGEDDSSGSVYIN